MRGRLYCPVGELEVDRTFGAEAVIGRSPQCTVAVQLTLVSAHHACIRWDSERGCYVLEDLGSSNGTRLDGEQVTEPRPLGHLHVITLSEHYDLVFQDLERCALRHGAARRAAGATAAGRHGARPASEPAPTMHTSIEVLDLPVPGPLKKTPKKTSPEKTSPGKTPEREKTLFQRFDLPLPGLLRRSGDDPTDDDGEGGTDRVEDPKSGRGDSR